MIRYFGGIPVSLEKTWRQSPINLLEFFSCRRFCVNGLVNSAAGRRLKIFISSTLQKCGVLDSLTLNELYCRYFQLFFQPAVVHLRICQFPVYSRLIELHFIIVSVLEELGFFSIWKQWLD